MPSRFDQMFSAAADEQQFDAFGEDIVWKLGQGESGANGRTIKAVVQRESRSLDDLSGNFTNDYNTMVIRVRSADNTVGVVAPKETRTDQSPSQATIDGKDWYVARILGSTAGTHRLLMRDGGVA